VGRYGFGLPCAAVSLGRRFTVYSRTAGARLYAVTIDIDEIKVALTTEAELPPFVADHLAQTYRGEWQSGTIIMIDKLDRLQWVTAKRLGDALANQLGVTYQKLLRPTALYVDGRLVEPIDPLFLTQGFRFYDIDDDRAQMLEAMPIEVTDPGSGEPLGKISVRYAWFPPSFGSVAKDREAVGLNANERFAFLKSYHGILFSRNGRLIDVQARTPWTTFINNDRYIKVEVEFSASLDDHFGVTTSKQQITVSPFIWDVLQQAGIPKAIEQMRNRLREAKAARRVQLLLAGRPETAGSAGETDDAEQCQLPLRPIGYRLSFEHEENEPFFKVSRESNSSVLHLNTAHSFFDLVYAAPFCTNEMRTALEALLLSTPGEDMIDKLCWSQRLHAELDVLRAGRHRTNYPQESLLDQRPPSGA
jgi:hypothetical protein